MKNRGLKAQVEQSGNDDGYLGVAPRNVCQGIFSHGDGIGLKADK